MNKKAVKICGVTRAKDALWSLQEGASLIGMIFAKKSPRYVTLEEAQPIAKAVKDAGGKTVGVFYDFTTEQMQHYIEALSLDLIQLHSSFAIDQGGHLPIPKLYVRQPGMGIEGLTHFDKDVDFLLYDHANGGSGIVLEWNSIAIPKGLRWFLAGGLNPTNVKEALHELNPYGVDVASGVENGIKGVKDQALITQFIQAVQHG